MAAGRADEVQVWVAPLDPPPVLFESVVATLDPAERARAGRYRFVHDARRFSAARGWLRHVLGAVLATHPADVRITDGPGKPCLEDGAGPCFNVAHGGDVALIAVAGREVGVDVEPDGAGRSGLYAAGLVCTPDEIARLDRLPAAQRAGAFLRTWTAKEAYLKAVGAGLSIAPDSVEIGGERAGSGARVLAAADPASARWRVRWFEPAHGYVGAVAAEGDHWRIRARSAAELLQPGVVGLGR